MNKTTEELARRLAAGAVSWMTGEPSMDRVLAEKGDTEIGEYWMILARHVQADMGEPSLRLVP